MLFTHRDNTQVSLGGSATSKLTFVRLGRKNVTATVKADPVGLTLQKGDTIIVTIKNYKAPKLEDAAISAY